MSMDLTLLRLCKNRDRFNRLKPGGEGSGLDASTELVINAIRAHFVEFPELKELNIPTFKGWCKQYRFNSIDEHRATLALSMIDHMKQDVEPELEQGMVERLLHTSLATQTHTLLKQYDAGEEIDLITRLSQLQEEYVQRMDRKAKTPLVKQTPEELMLMDECGHGIEFRLRELREQFRPMRGGDFGIYAMRPDAGKTTFLTSESSHWVTQLQGVWPDRQRVGAWFNNEGPGARIKQRWYQSLLDATVPEMVAMMKAGTLTKNIEEAMGNIGLDCMLFFDVHDFYSHEVEAIVKQYDIGFAIFDMIDNIKFTGGMANGGQRTDQILEEMYKWGRNLCVKYDMIGWATSQLSADAEGLQYPTQSMLKDSKTGKQGACDFILTGGKVNDPAMEGFRFMGAPKNKLQRPGVAKRSQIGEVYFDGERGRFRSPE